MQDVMMWVGHKDLKVILRYAAKLNIRKLENRRKAAAMFEQFSSVAD